MLVKRAPCVKMVQYIPWNVDKICLHFVLFRLNAIADLHERFTHILQGMGVFWFHGKHKIAIVL